MRVLVLAVSALLVFPAVSVAQEEERAFFCIAVPASVIPPICDGVSMPKEACEGLMLIDYLEGGEEFEFLPATACGPEGEGTSGSLVDPSASEPATLVALDDLKVGDSFEMWGYSEDEYTTVTLEDVEFGIPTSRFSKPGKGMTTMALSYSFEAGPGGGSTDYVEAFGPDGAAYDKFYSAEGKYGTDWGYVSDIRPGSTVKGWTVFEVPAKGTVEVVMSGLDESGEEVFATWVIKH
jgi:hypothetical protein